LAANTRGSSTSSMKTANSLSLVLHPVRLYHYTDYTHGSKSISFDCDMMIRK
jgi:hypothetical protein